MPTDPAVLPLPDNIGACYEAALQVACILPDQVKALPEHDCAIIPLLHDGSRRDTVAINVFTQALVWGQQAATNRDLALARVAELEGALYVEPGR